MAEFQSNNFLFVKTANSCLLSIHCIVSSSQAEFSPDEPEVLQKPSPAKRFREIFGLGSIFASGMCEKPPRKFTTLCDKLEYYTSVIVVAIGYYADFTIGFLLIAYQYFAGLPSVFC